MEWEAEHQSLGGRAIFMMALTGFHLWLQRLWVRVHVNKIKSLPVQAWNALGPGHISKHSLSHTQMHNFLTQTINAGKPRHWQHNAKITFYSCNRIARDSCWWQAKTLTFFLWRRLGPWSHHSSPGLPRVGGTAGGGKRRESNQKPGIRKITSQYCLCPHVGVGCGKKVDNNAGEVYCSDKLVSKS